MRANAAALGLALTLAACASPPPPPPAPDLAAAEQEIRSTDAAWLAAAGARDAAGEAALFAEDGIAYREMAEPLAGPAAYQAYSIKYFADNPKAVSTWTTRAVHVAPSGDLAVQTGTFTETAAGPKGDKENHGNFVTVWKKVGD
jgi:ketosteroid isomerase-like protein